MAAAIKRVTRVDRLTPEQEARFAEWRDKWIEIGLRTGPADRDAFARHVAGCYRAAGLEPPKRIVWVPSPFVLAFAAPAAALAIEWRKAIAKDPRVAAALLSGIAPYVAVDGAVDGAVHGAVGVAVDGAVGGAVDVAVDGAVHGAVDVAVRGAVGVAVHVAVGGAVGVAVHGAVDGAVGVAVHGAPIARAVVEAIQRAWPYRMGGQFWAGGWWGSPAYVSFFREVCGLTLGDEMDARAIAYAGTVESACWWWPHRDFVMVSERPTHIDRDDRGRLHSDTRRAIEWPDGWGLYRWHGVDVPEKVIVSPEAITTADIDGERNAEVRRVMIDRFGLARYVREAKLERLDVSTDRHGTERTLYRGHDGRLFVHLYNSTIDADGSRREYVVACHPELRPWGKTGAWDGPAQPLTALNAVASTYGMRGEEYERMQVET